MKKIRMVRQRFKSDCGVACVAMLARVSYWDAFSVFGFAEGGKHFYTIHKHLIEALNILGCEVKRIKFSSWQDIHGCAIVPVNRRRNGRNFHWVVFDGQSVRDPNPKRPLRVKSFEKYRASGWYLLAISDSGE